MKRKVMGIVICSLFLFPACVTAEKTTSMSGNQAHKAPYVPFIIKKSFELIPSEFFENISGEMCWWGGPVVLYTVVGLGKHSIHWEVHYTVYTYDTHVEQPQIGIFQGNDTIYTFDLRQRPIIKIKTEGNDGMIFFLYKSGDFVGKLFIDGKVVSESSINWTHH